MEGLPVMVVDEDIYRRPPSLLIATVDKFAQMPWKGETQNLFGQLEWALPASRFSVPGNRGRRLGQSSGTRQLARGCNGSRMARCGRQT